MDGPRPATVPGGAEWAVTLDQATELVYRLRDQLTSPLGGNEGTATRELAAVLRQLLDEPEPG